MVEAAPPQRPYCKSTFRSQQTCPGRPHCAEVSGRSRFTSRPYMGFGSAVLLMSSRMASSSHFSVLYVPPAAWATTLA